MEGIINGSVLMILIVLACIDLRKKEVNMVLLIVLICVISCLGFILKDLTVAQRLLGATVGISLLGVSKLTNGGLGIADGIVFIGLGIYCGMLKSLIILFYALLVAAVISMILLVLHKIKKKDTIPFLPFVVISYIGVWLT